MAILAGSYMHLQLSTLLDWLTIVRLLAPQTACDDESDEKDPDDDLRDCSHGTQGSVASVSVSAQTYLQCTDGTFTFALLIVHGAVLPTIPLTIPFFGHYATLHSTADQVGTSDGTSAGPSDGNAGNIRVGASDVTQDGACTICARHIRRAHGYVLIHNNTCVSGSWGYAMHEDGCCANGCFGTHGIQEHPCTH
jgi:hypothetical protein